MKSLIKHFWENNRDQVVAKSLLNCHIKNVHSIMLLDSPGMTIRMFIAENDHELWRNGEDPYNSILAVHPHHCDITLCLVKGQLTNITYELGDRGRGVLMGRYLWESKINGGSGRFTDQGLQLFKSFNIHDLQFPGSSISMEADCLHTVSCPQNRLSAWIVFEGKEDPNYKPFAYSLHDLTKFDPSGLYIKPTEQELQYFINCIL